MPIRGSGTTHCHPHRQRLTRGRLIQVTLSEYILVLIDIMQQTWKLGDLAPLADKLVRHSESRNRTTSPPSEVSPQTVVRKTAFLTEHSSAPSASFVSEGLLHSRWVAFLFILLAAQWLVMVRASRTRPGCHLPSTSLYKWHLHAAHVQIPIDADRIVQRMDRDLRIASRTMSRPLIKRRSTTSEPD